jgi:hypothetical protein
MQNLGISSDIAESLAKKGLTKETAELIMARITESVTTKA